MKAKQSEPNTPKLSEERLDDAIDRLEPYFKELYKSGSFAGFNLKVAIKKEIAQELSTLKAQVRKEIEEKRDDWKGLEEMTTTDIAGEIYRALDDCLSIPSLKGEE